MADLAEEQRLEYRPEPPKVRRWTVTYPTIETLDGGAHRHFKIGTFVGA
jgi:hypothetical protein